MQTLHRFPERPDPLLTIVVPCFQEEETIPEFHQRITRVVKRLPVSCEILYVDDGSNDRTADILRHYQDGSSVRCLSLSRNFGKEAALSAGIDHARGSALIFIDVDLQDPPELIAAMVDYWQRGYDVVNMQRNLRIGDSWFKRMSARAYYWVMQRLVEKVDMPADVSDFRLIGPAPLAALRALDERSRILKGMIGWVGLVIPHFARMIVGCDYRKLLPASMLMGASFLLIVDDVARLVASSEIPIGILTAFVGAPFFLYLITRRKQGL